MLNPYVNVLIIRSKNLTQAKEFYKQLGLDFIFHKHGSGPEHLAYRNNGVVFEIYPLLAESTSTSSTRLGFKVDSIDVIFKDEKLKNHIITRPRVSQWGRVARLSDPDDHIIDLFESELL
jgi:hypothetical protein